MDNLFAVIVPNNSSININDQLSKAHFAKKESSISRIIDEKFTIHLCKYSSQVTALFDNNDHHEEFLQSPIIANRAVNLNSDLNAICNPELTEESEKLASDEQLLLSVFKQWGPLGFAKVKGDFQSIFWDQKSQLLCAAIDAFSSRSLFYVQIDNALYIASDAKTLAETANINLTVNIVALSQWLAGRPTLNSSMYNEISRLPAGHCLEYGCEQEIKVTKFWDIDPNFKINYKSTEDYKSHFYDVLQTSVANSVGRNQQPEKNAVFCQMSGGMDSTSITAIAKKLLDEQNRPLHTISHQYKNTQSCDESNCIADMIEKLKLEHAHYIELDQYESTSFADLYPTDFDSPGIVLSPKYHQELALMKSLGANVLLTGNGGDEMCWGHSASYRSRLYKGEFGVINEVINACKQLNEPIARSLYTIFTPLSMQNLVKLARQKPTNNNECPAWLTQQAVDIIKSENKDLINPFSAAFNPARHARYHAIQTTSTYNAMRSYQKIASEYGIDVRHPFFDADVVKFSFAIPEKLLIQGIYPKWLLRHTMQEYLPASVCWNKHKVVFDHHFANLVRNNQVELRKLLSHEGLQDLGLLDNRILLEQFDAVVNNPNGHLNVDMLYTILTQLWFQTHCIGN